MDRKREVVFLSRNNGCALQGSQKKDQEQNILYQETIFTIRWRTFIFMHIEQLLFWGVSNGLQETFCLANVIHILKPHKYNAKFVYVFLTKGVSAPPTMATPMLWVILGISTCETSPSRTGRRVMPEKTKQRNIQMRFRVFLQQRP